MKNNYVLFIGLVFVILLLISSLIVEHNTILDNRNNDNLIILKNSIKVLDPLAYNVTHNDKVSAIKVLKALSLDEKNPNEIRIASGQAVVSNFFDNGTSLFSGFSTSTIFNEREIYDYAKYINTLGNNGKNNLLVTYIGLRFYDKELTRQDVAESLHLFQDYVNEKVGSDSCFASSKFASVIYLSQKSEHADVSDEFGNYYINFEKTFNTKCSEDRKVMVAFMWLAAISDIGNSEMEESKAKQLVSFVTKDATENSRLVKNLKQSYFSEIKEPDTVSIVERLRGKYPDFDDFIEKIK